MVVVACSESEKSPFNYRGLELSLPIDQVVEALEARGFAVDSAASDSGNTVVLANPSEKYRVLIAYENQNVKAIQETYHVSTNDSTRRLWQQLRDDMEKELGAWPNCPMLKDDHKVANFDASDGFISIILENTYKPTLKVLYTPKKKAK